LRRRVLVGRIQLLLILLLLLLLLLHLLHQLLGSLRSVLIAISKLRTGIDLRSWRHHGMAEPTRWRRRLVRVLILIFRGIGDGDAFVGLRLVVLDRLARSVALCGNRRRTLPRRQNHLLHRARIASGHAQDDVVELRSVQQRVQHITWLARPQLRYNPLISRSGRDVNGSTGPRLYSPQHLRQSGVRGIDRQHAILKGYSWCRGR